MTPSLTLTKGQGHTKRSKITDMDVSAFSECFLFDVYFYTSTKLWRGYILLQFVCVSVCLSVCPAFPVNKITAERMH